MTILLHGKKRKPVAAIFEVQNYQVASYGNFHQQASFVAKILRIGTFCAGVFFSTLLPWEFIYAKLRNLTILKLALGGEICSF